MPVVFHNLRKLWFSFCYTRTRQIQSWKKKLYQMDYKNVWSLLLIISKVLLIFSNFQVLYCRVYFKKIKENNFKYLSQQFDNNILDLVKKKAKIAYQRKVLQFFNRQRNYWQIIWTCSQRLEWIWNENNKRCSRFLFII